MWRYFFLILITLKKNTNVLDSRQLLEKGHLFGNELGGSSKEKASASVGFVAGYEACQREYEDKLRWIPIEEELPTIHVDVILKCESGFWDKGCLIHQSGDNMFSSSSGDLDIVTHWRPISFL